MKRWLLAGAVLLGGAVGLSHADYVIIIANLSGARQGGHQGPAGGFGGFGNLGGPPPGGFGMGGFGMGGIGDSFVGDAMEPIYVVAVVETQPLTYNQLLAIEKGPLPQIPVVQIIHKWGTTQLVQ